MWPAVIAGVGALAGWAGSRDRGNSVDAQNRWLQTPTVTRENLEPWGGTTHWLNQAIDRYGQEAMYNWKPSYYDQAPPQFRGGGGANQFNQGMNQWMNDPGSLGQNMSDFIGGGLGNGNQHSRAAFDETMDFSPWRIDEAMGAIPGLAETPYMHQFIQQGMGFDPSSIMNMASQFADGFGGWGGGGGGGGAMYVPDLGEPTNDWMRDTLDGKWLNESNPHLQKLIEDFNYQTSEGYKTLDVPQLDSEYIRAGRYGGNAYATAQALSKEKAQRAIAGNTAGILAGNYEAERGRMNDQQGMLNQLDQTKLSTAAQVAAANASAGASAYGSRMGAMSNMFGDSLGALTNLYLGNQGNTLEAILGYGDQRLQGGALGLEAAGMGTEADLARLGLLSDQGSNSMQYDLGLLGAGNDLLGTAMDAYGQAGQLRNQGAGARYAADMERWQYEKDKHDYYRDAEMNHSSGMMDRFMGPAALFGSRNTWGYGPGVSGGQMGQAPSEWAGALQGLLGGLFMGNSFGSGFGSGGGVQ